MLVEKIRKDKMPGLPLRWRRNEPACPVGRCEATWIFMLLILVLPIAAFGAYTWYQNKFEKLPVYGKESSRIQPFVFTNQDGHQIALENFKDKIIVADFFFTHCASICPKMSKSLKRVQDKFSNDSNIQLLSFTVDPERDSTLQLSNYARQFGINSDQWSLLTGDKKEMYKLARNSFMIVATDGDGGPNDFIHSEKLVLLDKIHRIRGYYDGTNEIEVNKLMNDIKKLKHED
jgi:protein SCO1